MRNRRFSRPYWFAFVPPVISVAKYVTEQYYSNAILFLGVFKIIPLWSIWAIVLAFIVGLLVQDFNHNGSWIWANWKWLTNKFEVESVVVGNPVDDPKRLEVILRIRFVKNFDNAKIFLRVYSGIKLKSEPQISVIQIEDLSDIRKGDTRNIKLATLVIPHPGYTPFHSTWGAKPLSVNLNAPSLIGKSKNIAEIELFGPWLIPQKHKFFVANLDFGGSEKLPSLYVHDEDDNFFDIKLR